MKLLIKFAALFDKNYIFYVFLRILTAPKQNFLNGSAVAIKNSWINYTKRSDFWSKKNESSAAKKFKFCFRGDLWAVGLTYRTSVVIRWCMIICIMAGWLGGVRVQLSTCPYLVVDTGKDAQRGNDDK